MYSFSVHFVQVRVNLVPGSGMTHTYILPNTEKGIVKWLQAVTDAEHSTK
ncbi:hypothetical protein GCM10027577_07400 [Spirosoma fluminis]